MLLDRKKIRKWAKWVALLLAIIFAVGFLFLGVGYGGAGFDLTGIFSCSDNPEPQVEDTKLNDLLAALEADPDNAETMQDIAAIYEAMYDRDAGEGTRYLDDAAEYLEQAISTDPSLKDVYLDLAKLYIRIAKANEESATAASDALTQSVYMSTARTAYKNAAKVLNKATAVDPDNPGVYLYLGIAQRGAGNEGEAILAWQKYLQLDPNGDQASVIRAELEELTATTTTASTSTTTAGSSTTTAGASTTTTGAATTTTTD